ncbi:DUF6573 family protein [Paludisphaera borealis]|uniref:Uncharacterized protein n=1 Tax=Paludisphaera borealis TaxID=1387353 RepID=A0A1U7CXA4_9BACT|nr:DUF6573 family protein [Paludisphaera borealis]APW63519.1 hypothetical protein BSF38_05091 [Paludisphaera borealis]
MTATKFRRWGSRQADDMNSGVNLGLDISWAELDELPLDRITAVEAGVPDNTLDDYEDDGGTYAPGHLRQWIEARTEPAWDLIHSYTRAQAIEDGTLVDVSVRAKEAGFKIPVALTRAVWSRYVEIPAGVDCQDEAGRLWDVLWMLHVAIGQTGLGQDTLSYQLYVRNDNQKPRLVNLKATCGPGDDAAPVLTILCPDED